MTNATIDQIATDPLLDGLRNGEWLDAQKFAPLRYVVPGLIPEGLSLMVGAPKIGKSWFTLDVCLAVAAGGCSLGRIRTGPSRACLYLALEDGDRRLQDRCRQLLLDSEPIPARFEYITRVSSPGEVAATVTAWLALHPHEHPFIAIDTLGKAMPLTLQGETTYQRDYRIMSELKSLCDDADIIVNHHDRKASADDFVDFVSGTNGLAGGADTLLVLSRERGEQKGILKVTGRDVAEGMYALKIEPRTWWQLDGETLEQAAGTARTSAATAGLGEQSSNIVRLVAQHPAGIGPSELGELIGMDGNKAGVYLGRLADAGRLQHARRGLYTPVESVESVVLKPDNPTQYNTNNTFNGGSQTDTDGDGELF